MLAYSDVITCVTCFSAGPDNAPDPALQAAAVAVRVKHRSLRALSHVVSRSQTLSSIAQESSGTLY